MKGYVDAAVLSTTVVTGLSAHGPAQRANFAPVLSRQLSGYNSRRC
jgi:hypothetical protein